MTNNDVLRSIRYLLNVSDAELAKIIGLANLQIGTAEIIAFLKRDDEPGYVECSHRVLAHFLNGLVVYKRGADPSRPPQAVEVPVTNNMVLKKVRAAFQLKDDDIIALLDKAGLRVSKAELGALCRRPDHRNYRECGDQVLRNLFKALASRPGPAQR